MMGTQLWSCISPAPWWKTPWQRRWSAPSYRSFSSSCTPSSPQKLPLWTPHFWPQGSERRGGGNYCCMSGHLTMFKTKYKFKESRFVLNVFNLCHKSLHICVWKWQLKQKENDCLCQCNKMLLKSLQNCIKLWINYKILIVIDYLLFIMLFGINILS